MPSLRLVGEVEIKPCPTCRGEGKVKNEDFQQRNGQWVKGGGYLPCPECRGKKVVSK